MSQENQDRKYIRQAWLVLALALAFGGVLAGVQVTLGPKIEVNKQNETYRQIPALVPGANVELTEEVAVGGETVYKAFAGEAGSPRHVGWVVKGGGQGFADRIEVLIGLDAAAETITGLYVLEQKETPGLGNKIVEPPFSGQFAGKTAERSLSVTKTEPGPAEIQAVTGATVSSRSVVGIVNETVAAFRAALAEQGG